MQILQQVVSTLTALVLALSAQVGDLGQAVSPASQLAQVVSTPATYDNSANASCNNSSSLCTNGTTLIYPLTVSNNANRQLAVFAFVGCNTGEIAPAISSVTYAGVPLTQTVSVNPNVARRGYLYTLPAGTQSTIGTNNVVVTLANNLSACNNTYRDTLTSGAISVYNVDQTSAYASTPISNSGSGTSATLTGFTSGANDLGISSICAGNGITNTTETSLWTSVDTNSSCGSNGGSRAIGGDTSFSWTIPSDSWITIGGAFKVASSGTPPPPDTTPPSTPSGLSATAVSSSQINLSWSASTDNVGVTGYDIYRGGTLLTSVTGTSYSNTGLSASTNYSYTVRAKDAAGNTSSQSTSASATTQSAATPPTGNTVTATSCSQTDVQNAINSVTSGGMVNVPAGNCTWSSNVSIPNTKGLTLNGGGATINGKIDLNLNSSVSSRITNFNFITPIRTQYQANDISVNGSKTSAPFRIDNNTLTSTQGGSVLLDINGIPPGLIDHNSFNSPSNSEIIHNNGFGAGNTSGWSDDITPGGSDMVYLEDNTFTNNDPSLATANPAYFWGNSSIQNYYGARMVFRNNTMTMSHVDVHGTPGSVGGRWWEIYNNRFVMVNNGSQSDYLGLRAGSGVVFNNTETLGSNVPDYATGGIKLQEEDSGGYPQLYQIGRGKNQVLDPAYIWNNQSAISINNDTPSLIQQNRDYYLSTKPGYTSFTYPYPLDANGLPNPSGGGTPPPAAYTLTVSKSGAGSGIVTGGSINCGSTCSQSNITSGTQITLTASPISGSIFAGWSGGGCSGTGSCVVNISANTTITAIFNTVVVSGGSYWISPTGTASWSGCNSQTPLSGTSACSFSTMSSNLAGGDTVTFRAGTYNLSGYFIVRNKSGTQSAPTAFKNYSGENVILRGSGYSSGSFYLDNSDYVTIDGLKITNMNQGIFVEGDSDNVTVKNCEVYDLGQDAIHFRGGSDNFLVENCQVHDTGRLNTNEEAFYIGTGENDPTPDYVGFGTIRNNTIYNISGGEAVELKPGAHDMIIEGNNIYNISNVSDFSGIGAIEIFGNQGNAQTWPSNPNHIVRNNIIHDSTCAINIGTGATVYNNIIYDIIPGNWSSDYAIRIENDNNDSYVRKVYHNTVDMVSSKVIYNIGGQTDIRNNIGPSTANNLAFNSAYVVSTTEGGENYRLVSGSSPINAGVNLTSIVSADIEGISRLTNGSPDIGAYEFASSGGVPIPGDLNSDHIVNALDYSLLNSKWLQNFVAYDLQVDGLINSLDFAILSSNWGKTW